MRALLLAAVALASAFAVQDLSIDPLPGLFRAGAAVLGVLAAWSMCRPPASTPAAPAADSDVSWLPIPLAAIAAWCLVQAHLAVPIATVDRITLLREGTPAWAFLVGDAGLPSLLHRGLNLLAAQVGGIGLVLCVHVALYALLIALLLDLSVRLAGRAAGVALVVAWGTAPPVYETFAGLRSYPSFLLLLLLAERGMVARAHGSPDDRQVVRALSLASLEIPSALSTLVAYAAGRLTVPARPRWLPAAVAAVVLGALPLALAAQRMHAVGGRSTGLDLSVGLPALACLLLLADAWRAGWQRAAVTAAAGSLGLVGLLVSVGVLDREPRYLYQSGLLPLVLVTAWLARRVRPRLGREPASALAGAVVLGLACHAHAWSVSLFEPTLMWISTVGLTGTSGLLTLTRSRWSAHLLTLATVSLLLTHLEGLTLRQAHAHETVAIVRRGLAVRSPDLALCTTTPAMQAHAEGIGLTRSWWAPARGGAGGQQPLASPGDPACERQALWLGTATELTACEALTPVTTHDLLLARCPAGAVRILTRPHAPPRP